MQVKLLVSRAGPAGSHAAGDVIDVSDAEAKRMIDANQASPVRVAPEPERAVRGSRKPKAS